MIFLPNTYFYTMDFATKFTFKEMFQLFFFPFTRRSQLHILFISVLTFLSVIIYTASVNKSIIFIHIYYTHTFHKTGV